MTYDLEKIEEVCKAATPGPWIPYICTESGKYLDKKCVVRAMGIGEVVGVRGFYRQVKDVEENANFIALARTALPELCARVRELEEQLRQYQIDECRLCGEFSFVEHIEDLESQTAAQRPTDCGPGEGGK